MSRYIDADKMIDGYSTTFPYDLSYCDDGDLMEWLNAQPTADVIEVVHAYWKETNHITESKRGREIHSKLYNCSNCDAPNGRKKSSYCHWCGAKMDGERKKDGIDNTIKG